VKPSTFKCVAWNGIQCAVPMDWTPGRIGFRHLVIESETGPAMEIKWSPVKRGFSTRKHLHRLNRSTGRQGGIFREQPLPEQWEKALQEYEAVGFDWDAGNQGARGAVVFCPACRTASLIQFFRLNRLPAVERQAVEVLATFTDHRQDGRVAWRMYDISALLPGEFHLKRYRFEAGRFVMEFSDRRRTLIVYRWAPARVLLKDRSLAMLAETVSAGAGEKSWPLTVAGHSGIEYHDPWPAGIGRRLKAYAGIARFRRVRLWHLKDRNRIFGALMESRFPIDAALLDAVCDGYGMADENP
jgi:hypothetical protein